MRDPINFLDHVVEYPGRFQETDLGNNLIQHDPAPGEIVQEGTPLNAANMNLLDTAALQAIMMGSLNSSLLRQLSDKVEAQAGEQIEVTLTNTQQYPFNNSNKAVQLGTNRNKKNYTVLVEVLSSEGGGVGEILVTNKLLNGFQIAYTGAASSVTVNCIVQGGF